MTYRDDERALRARHDLLSKLRIASPCDAPWYAMVGDDRVRQCLFCDRKVYALSELTSAEAIDLLRANREHLPCVRLHRRRDGTLITADCPRGAASRKRRLAIAFALGASAALAAPYQQTIRNAIDPPPIPGDRTTVAAARDRPPPARGALEAESFFRGPRHRDLPDGVGGMLAPSPQLLRELDRQR